MMLKITINGKPHSFPEPATLSGILSHLGIDPARVAIEHNGTILLQKAFPTTPVAAGDQLEIVQFVGGG